MHGNESKPPFPQACILYQELTSMYLRVQTRDIMIRFAELHTFSCWMMLPRLSPGLSLLGPSAWPRQRFLFPCKSCKPSRSSSTRSRCRRIRSGQACNAKCNHLWSLYGNCSRALHRVSYFTSIARRGGGFNRSSSPSPSQSFFVLDMSRSS